MVATGRLPISTFSTLQHPIEKQFDVWKNGYEAFETVSRSCQHCDKGFAASYARIYLGDMIFTTCETDSASYVRSNSEIKRTPLDLYMVTLQVEGASDIITRERRARAEQGEIAILDLSQEYMQRKSKSKAYTLYVPHETIHSKWNYPSGLNGVILDRDSIPLLSDYLHILAKNIGRLAETDVQAISQITQSLINTSLTESADKLEPTPRIANQNRFHRVRAYIEQNLHSTDLNPRTICANLRISRSLLYIVFEPYGGVNQYIQSKRLSRIKSALSNDTHGKKVYQIAYEFGFSNVSSFNRIFKAKYGFTPKEIKSQLDLLTLQERSDNFSKWLQIL